MNCSVCKKQLGTLSVKVQPIMDGHPMQTGHFCPTCAVNVVPRAIDQMAGMVSALDAIIGATGKPEDKIEALLREVSRRTNMQ